MSQIAVETADIPQALRDLVELVLRNGYLGATNSGGKLNDWTESQYGANGVTQQVHREALRRGLPVDGPFWNVITEHIWTLARVGAIALLPRDPPTIGGVMPEAFRGIPSFVITDFGRRLLTDPSVSPHDWAKYQAAVRVKVANPDDIVMVHLGEAVAAWKSGLNRASAVMLGCAVERAIILLAEAMRDASLPAPADTLGRKLENPKVGIADIYEIVRATLENLTNDKKLPGGLADTWERRLTPAFEHTRILRNKSGHPTGASVSGDDAHSGLLLFPGFYELVDKLIAVIRGLAAPSAAGGSV